MACRVLCGKGRVRTQDLRYQSEALSLSDGGPATQWLGLRYTPGTGIRNTLPVSAIRLWHFKLTPCKFNWTWNVERFFTQSASANLSRNYRITSLVVQCCRRYNVDSEIPRLSDSGVAGLKWDFKFRTDRTWLQSQAESKSDGQSLMTRMVPGQKKCWNGLSSGGLSVLKYHFARTCRFVLNS